jgi:5-methylcytosine-specific restriction endonuclease McrA
MERRQHSHARQRGVEPIPAEAQADILELFGGRCAYCPALATTWDHIIPISGGGRTTPGNVVPCCLSCNSKKGNRDPDDWLDDVCAREAAHPALSDRLALADGGLYG